MATKHIRVRVSFTHQSDHQIEETSGTVITGMTGMAGRHSHKLAE